MAGRQCQRLGGRDPDAQPGERAGAGADRDPIDRLPARSRPTEQLLDQHEQTLGVARSPAGRRVIDGGQVDDRAQADVRRIVEVAQRDRRQRGRRVEGEHPHLNSTVRRSPPPWLRRTRRTIRPRSLIS